MPARIGWESAKANRVPMAVLWFLATMLHLVGSRMTETTNATATVCGFCNAGPVSLTVNGRKMGSLAPDDVNCVIWKDVSLSAGANRIELEAGSLKACATWNRR